MHSFTLSVFTWSYASNFILKLILAKLSWRKFSCVQKNMGNKRQPTFIHAYTFKVFRALLSQRLLNLLTEELCSGFSVTSAFWYLLNGRFNSCDELDYRNINYVKLIYNFPLEHFYIFYHKMFSFLKLLQFWCCMHICCLWKKKKQLVQRVCAKLWLRNVPREKMICVFSSPAKQSVTGEGYLEDMHTLLNERQRWNKEAIGCVVILHWNDFL